MKDDSLRRTAKRAAALLFQAETAVRESARRRGAGTRFDLAGSCRSCGQCCENPALRVGRLFRSLGPARAAFLWWQSRVNGFDLVGEDPAESILVFRCSHFDPSTRRCDSYESRPGICRDYPKALLCQPWPELFDGCGYRPVAANRQSFQDALSRAGCSDEKRAELARKLHLE